MQLAVFPQRLGAFTELAQVRQAATARVTQYRRHLALCLVHYLLAPPPDGPVRAGQAGRPIAHTMAQPMRHENG